MNHSLLSSARAQLINQLVYFDEERFQFLDQYFADEKEKKRGEQFVEDYTRTLEHIIAHFEEETLHSVALIGSRIATLEDTDEESFTIVFPHQADPDRNQISFLAPYAFQLLLAARDENRAVSTPIGSSSVQVRNVEYVNMGEPFHKRGL
ncbi:GreA/GreB family elongation factor [Paenibacillus doosanensis]|uniref:Transcription elongation factor GreA n=1 Tax=Paenibacillus konkukensis TaxID=2020716 RepID=A0ABY4RRG3_9BACL|nr:MULTISPECIES: GreA/GreB family elongation factor [Paenibacillus]MCS7462036.1 GreA/GreB family elongation factor [Paenibacillus doosanensis]UQZ85101.1 Transcription elongation factor GreA [Paenibacillus konkukensis]